MLGDCAGDAYVALTRTLRLRRAVDILVTDCNHAIVAVLDAPPELAARIAAMEARPKWVDMQLVVEGAAYERNVTVNLSPFLIRGGFIATFLNKYSAMPMVLTGTLSHAMAARRVKEPRLVCHNPAAQCPKTPWRGVQGGGDVAADTQHGADQCAVTRPHLDAATYGVPIPQLDQMPTGLIPIYFLSEEVLAKGRQHLTGEERERVEIARYCCFLLGFPEDLLAAIPRQRSSKSGRREARRCAIIMMMPVARDNEGRIVGCQQPEGLHQASP